MNYKLFFLLTVILYNPCAKALLPQPGENIWHMTAEIGTEVDLLTNDMITITSKLDILSTCTAIAINNATTIAAAGSYCLSADIVFITLIYKDYPSIQFLTSLEITQGERRGNFFYPFVVSVFSSCCKIGRKNVSNHKSE